MPLKPNVPNWLLFELFAMFLVDNNLSPRLVKVLRVNFPDSAHVFDFGLEAADDQTVWAFAETNNLHILTKDRDFVELLHMRGFPPKVIKLNGGNATTQFILDILKRETTLLKSFLNSPQYGLLVLQ